MQNNEVSYFMGKKLEDMSKEELINAIHILANINDRQRKDHKLTLDMWDSFNKARSKF